MKFDFSPIYYKKTPWKIDRKSNFGVFSNFKSYDYVLF